MCKDSSIGYMRTNQLFMIFMEYMKTSIEQSGGHSVRSSVYTFNPVFHWNQLWEFLFYALNFLLPAPTPSKHWHYFFYFCCMNPWEIGSQLSWNRWLYFNATYGIFEYLNPSFCNDFLAFSRSNWLLLYMFYEIFI